MLSFNSLYSIMFPVTTEVRRLSSATKCRACSLHEPSVSKARGTKVWVAERSAYLAVLRTSDEVAAALALAVPCHASPSGPRNHRHSIRPPPIPAEVARLLGRRNLCALHCPPHHVVQEAMPWMSAGASLAGQAVSPSSVDLLPAGAGVRFAKV